MVVARNRARVIRAHAMLDAARAAGVGEEDLRWLDGAEARRLLEAARCWEPPSPLTSRSCIRRAWYSDWPRRWSEWASPSTGTPRSPRSTRGVWVDDPRSAPIGAPCDRR